jgi:hypothetical protein
MLATAWTATERGSIYTHNQLAENWLKEIEVNTIAASSNVMLSGMRYVTPAGSL